jgi:hypothetical protein
MSISSPWPASARSAHRIHGDRQRTTKKAGWEYAHVAIDDHGRVAYEEVLPDQRGDTDVPPL